MTQNNDQVNVPLICPFHGTDTKSGPERCQNTLHTCKKCGHKHAYHPGICGFKDCLSTEFEEDPCNEPLSEYSGV